MKTSKNGQSCGVRFHHYCTGCRIGVGIRMQQETFTDFEYSFRKKKTKREAFLEIIGLC